jgi:hypothetical protein
MKVSELIELLQFQEPDLEVHFSYGYGDHWRTEVAPAVGSIKEGFVGYSDYHRMDKVLDDEDVYPDEDYGNPGENAKRVVLIG